MRTINELIWHTSATPEGRHVTVEDIDRWHKARGWRGIGYHKVVYLDGSVHDGRPEEHLGAHVAGHNRNTIGYCYIGGVEANDVKKAKDTRTPEQRLAMLELTKQAIKKYNLTKISGHNDYANKACPCFPAKAEYSRLLPTETAIPVAGLSILRAGDRGWRVKTMQARLNYLGYPLVVDSHYGQETKHKVAAFQLDAEISSDGIAGPVTMAALEEAVPRDAGARGVADLDDLRKRGSRIVTAGDKAKRVGGLGLASMFGAESLNQLGLLDGLSSMVGKGQQFQGVVGSIQGLLKFATDHWFWILPVVGVALWWQINKIQKARLDDHQEGKTV